MKIKKVQLSLIVLFALAIASFSFFAMAEEQTLTNKNIFLDTDQDGLSDEEEKTYGTNPQIADTDSDGYSDGAEVQSGYNPTKPAPGDRITPTATIATPVTTTASADSTGKNMTDEVTQKISTLVNSSDSDNQDITVEKVKSIVDESLGAEISPDELPEVTLDEITLKPETSLKGLSETEVAQVKKEDFADYITGVSYIMSSNSPEPITSTSDLTTMSNSLTQDFTTGIASQNPESIKKILSIEQRVVDQMKSIPVPADLVETHVEALRIAKYSQNLDEMLIQDPNDPIANITNFSKASSFMDYASNFSNELNEKFNTYGLTYDESIKTKLTSYGAQLPNDELIKALFQ